jgi:hypothetical protein
MKTIVLGQVIAAAVICALLFATISPGFCQQELIGLDYFPLRKGTYWVYSAHVDWTVPDTAGETRQDELIWKSEVIDVFAKGNVFAARLRGFVYDLSWYEPDKGAGDYVIVLVGINHYYLIGHDADAFWQELINSDGESRLEEIGEDNLFLEVPLTKGAIYGEASQTPRGWYCSVVTDETPFDLSAITGAPALSSAIEFSIVYRTCPDHSILRFTPGVGVTGFEYRHHGTVANCEAKLLEFHRQ